MQTVYPSHFTRRFADRREGGAATVIPDRRRAERRAASKMDTGRILRRPSGLIWLPLGLLIVALIYVAANFAGIFPDAPPQDGEVIVYDPGENVSSAIAGSGYTVVESVDLKELGLKVNLLKIPAGMTVPEALADLRVRFPGLEIDVNSHIRPSDP